MGVTLTGLSAVNATLESSEVRLLVNLRKAAQVTATKIKADARSRISGHKYLPQYPYSITYDTKITPVSVEVEIGPDRAREQGPLGRIIEFGTAKNAPLPHMGPALEANTDDFQHGVEIAVQQALQ